MGFNVGVTALRANMAALQVVGHNIANVNTPGFSRQHVDLQQVPGQKFGTGYFGKGVQVASVDRAFNQFLTREANLSAAAAESANIRFQRLQTLEQLFPMGEAGVGHQLNGFLNAWADTVASPTNQTARSVVLSRAEEFSNRLNQTASQLEELRATTRVQIEAGIEQANRLGASIAQLNQRIVDAYAGGTAPNDLLDQRDRLVADLNKIVQVNTLEADDRSLTVFVGGSVPLVLGVRATPLVGSESVSAEGRYTIGFGSAGAIINEDLLAGGQLRGVLAFYNDDVAAVATQLGRLALSTLELTNRQHRAGLDLNGNQGVDFFRALPASYFTASVSVVSGSVAPPGVSWSIDSAAAAPASFQASDYRISFTAAGTGSITRVSDGHSVAFTPPATDLTLDGLRFAGLNTGAPNTEVLVRPFRGAAAAMAVNLSAPSQLALASPVVVAATAGNSGNVQVEALHRPAGQSPPFTLPATIAFVAGGYTLNGGAVQPFVSGQPIVANGFSLTLRGSPAVGDSFTVSDAAGLDMRQNAGNAQALLALRDLDALDGYTLSDGYIPVFASVSSSIQVAQAESDFATRVAAQAEAVRANQSGVNLDEEAARLMQFQQAYQASARYLQSIQSIFETLLATFGR
ncbi:flagellar hook-associated protein [Serpentinimonas raichei]|uniref:Flagellar hook-associated protein 1 n=1 Tax=Serpentinimonas raichei TaxID=1458425 RepID=A0A060NH47_9BURK|nr:flagellar hook-associated protein FlgK [Serpentinimonas raichei]BAO80352.1 flagellar hook-associated protein [Serpentinimonas raichei]